MPKKRNHGDGGLYFDKRRNLWRGVVDLEPDPITGRRRQKYVYARKQVDCRAKLNELKEEIAEHGEPLDKSITVEAWAKRWLEDIKKPSVDPKTFDGYVSAVRQSIVPVIGQKKVAAVKPSDIHAIRKHVVVKKGRSSTTALHAYRTVSMLLEEARREGLCRRNVAKDVDPPIKSTVERNALDSEAAARVLAAALEDDELGSLWWFKLLAGPRQGEGTGAVIEDLHLGDDGTGEYFVHWKLEELPREHGCGEQTLDGWPCGKKRGASCSDPRWRVPDGFRMRELYGRWALTEPKSRTGRRVPIIPQLGLVIRQYLQRTNDRPNPYGLIWRDENGLPYTPKYEAQKWRELLHRAGIITEEQLAPGASPIDGHWARHTTVTLLAQLGVDMQVIGEIVGHSAEEVTAIYRHVHAKEKKAAMEALGDLVLPQLPAA